MTAMERPVYYIKGVVRDGAEATQDFVGPLDSVSYTHLTLPTNSRV